MKHRYLRNTRRILVADQDRSQANLLSTSLIDEGFEAIVATTAEDVCMSMECSNFDLCILDASLPEEMFSLNSCTSGRVMSFTPVILMTETLQPVDKKKNAFCPAPICLLAKPFTLRDFCSVVRSILGQLCVIVTTEPHRRLNDEFFAF